MNDLNKIILSAVVAVLPVATLVAQVSPSSHELALAVSVKGEITVDGTRLTFDQLSEKVKTALAAAPDLVIVIQSEEETPLAIMTKVFDACRRVGATKFTMAPKKRPETDKPSNGNRL